jgi:serine protease Do
MNSKTSKTSKTRKATGPGIAMILVAVATLVIFFDNADVAAQSRPVESWTVADVVEQVAPSVVNVFTTRTIEVGRGPNRMFNDPLFRRFFGDPNPGQSTPSERTQTSLGSGVIFSSDGLIITNNHVVRGADEVKVGFSDGSELVAQVVGTDAASDLALLRVESDDLPAVRWADSKKLRVGDAVLAIGNPFGLGETVTRGIVSAKGRSLGMVNYEDFIQTDASINPGNSGGALINLNGEVVGINSAMVSRSGGSQGIGFAIPSYLVQDVIESLRDRGRVVRGYLGVYPQELTPELARASGVDLNRGVLISEVIPNSPADKAGVQRGDIVTRLNGDKVESMPLFRTEIGHLNPEERVRLDLIRNGSERSLEVVLEERPSDGSLAAVDAGDAEPLNTGGFRVDDLDARLAERLGLDSDLEGAVVTAVEPGSIAERAGLRAGDLIVEASRDKVGSAQQLRRALRAAAEAQDTLLMLIVRGGQTFYMALGPLGG